MIALPLVMFELLKVEEFLFGVLVVPTVLFLVALLLLLKVGELLDELLKVSTEEPLDEEFSTPIVLFLVEFLVLPVTAVLLV